MKVFKSVVKETQFKYGKNTMPKIKIASSEDAYEFLSALYSEDELNGRESFYMLSLNRQNNIIGYFQISVGGVAGTVVDKKIVFREALQKLASSIILCHNHPSGNLKPSQADIDITKQIRSAAELLDIKLLDHVILSSEGYFSFMDEGLI